MLRRNRSRLPACECMLHLVSPLGGWIWARRSRNVLCIEFSSFSVTLQPVLPNSKGPCIRNELRRALALNDTVPCARAATALATCKARCQCDALCKKHCSCTHSRGPLASQPGTLGISLAPRKILVDLAEFVATDLTSVPIRFVQAIA